MAVDLDSRRELLLKEWSEGPLDLDRRDALLEEMRELNLFPRLMREMDEWEREGGLYPDLDDSRFTEKLMAKQEFAESKQRSIADQMREGFNPCDPDREFELSPVQRFVSRFLSPQCPYQSALLFHGVGVGKTCAAITIAENYLRSYPRRSVFIIAPRTIQPGFRREIFDTEELQIPEEDTLPNIAKGCTGNSYLKRTATEFEKNRKTVIKRVTESINARYTILGYIQFFRYIQDILDKVPAGLSDEDRRAAEVRYLRREFSGRLVIIDEAHNLRDTPAEAADDDVDTAGGDTEMAESGAGKKLTPALLRVLEAAEGMKLVLATATPMYNSYKEIIFLLNLLLINDKRDKRVSLSESLVFQPNGEFRKSTDGRLVGAELLGSVAAAYVSFMRGENPLSFPVRLPPQGAPVLESWPAYSPTGEVVSENARKRMTRLPFVPVTFEGDSADEYEQISSSAIEAGGIGVVSIDEMVQAGNWLFPGDDGPQVRDFGFDNCFKEGGSVLDNDKKSSESYSSRVGPPTWLLEENLGTSSPKAKFILERLKTCRGISFIYSRYIKSGALPLALALEANGYTPWGDRPPLLADGIQDKRGRQCALCERREAGHGTQGGHRFVPAKYVLITGKASISKNNPAAIQASRAKTNMLGQEVKVVIGSSVASEGVNFRFMREVYVFDSWFHLNKLEQVLGRGIRSCSHAMLPKEKRNCTTYLLVNAFREKEDAETADLYMYRQAMAKALQVGRVTRVLKEYALDCNLNRNAILITGLLKQKHIDSQGDERPEVDVNDTNFTSMCDWIECEYDCAKPIDISEEGLDTSTYDEYAVRWREVELKRLIRKLFESKRQPAFQLETIVEALKGIPPNMIGYILSDIVGNRTFQIRVRGIPGYIVYRNGYYLFQPEYLADIRIPMSLRLADIPVRKDHFTPTDIRLRVVAAEEEGEAVEKKEEEGVEEGAVVEEMKDSVQQYWSAMETWANEIRGGTAKVEDLPKNIKRAILARFEGDEDQKREQNRLIMVNWFYEMIMRVEDMAKQEMYLGVLADVLLEFVWDEGLRSNEQQKILKAGGVARTVASEQIVIADSKTMTREAFRYIDVFTGRLQYICEGKPCSPAVAMLFENKKEDPLRGLQANMNTMGKIYGFIVPKGKAGRLVFKTIDTPSSVGSIPPKGAECDIVSTVSHHIHMLKEIGDIFEREGFPRFLLVDEVLDEKARRVKEKKEAKEAGRALPAVGPVNPNRTFENVNKACSLKDISLRWLDKMVKIRGRTPSLRYFLRPIAAYKSQHKGIALKEK